VPLHELDGSANVRRVVCPAVPANRSARTVYQNSVYPLVLRRAGLDAVLGTCNVMPLASPRPFVVTIQSLQCFTHPATFGRARAAYLRLAIRSSLRRADGAIAVSHFAKEEAVRLTGVAPDRVHAVPLGVFPSVTAWRDATAPSAPGAAPYILAASTLYRFKNVARLIEAYAILRAEHGVPHRLRIAGGDADVTAASLRALAATLGVQEWVDFLGRVRHEEMPGHYARADLFVYPSLYETFGHPPLEAMTVGCPVVAARSASIPEIVGDAAELVDPQDAAAMARGMAHVLFDPQRRRELVRLGRERVGAFTWERTASRTLEILTRAINRSRTTSIAYAADA
jgi:glycosyltransferase involved in cell wall biosynthesis